ncbi:hypothetical protein QCA50_011301 [Cerrena zonata]|uniref:DUF6533 domain-containing protein n=1 Tax=Cerrena zonata TaxID=2478898 RepID=A0AAW0FWK1_9APHY
MSQVDTDAKIAAFLALVAEKVYEMRLANGFAVAATTLLVYDYILTLPAEISCIWKRKLSAGTLIYFINRYGSLLYRTLMVVQMVSFENATEAEADLVCNGILRFSEGLVFVLQATVALFMALRLYAIWNSDRRIFAIVFGLGIVTPALNIYYYTTLKIIALPSPLVGCGESVNLDTSSAKFVFNRVYAIAFDALVLVLTFAKTAGILKLFSVANVQSTRKLIPMLLRDGTVYFAALLALNVANLIAISFQIFGALPALTDVVTAILISRFMLNLRSVYTTTVGSSSYYDPDKTMSNVNFAHSSGIVGNLGAPLKDYSFMYDDDDEEEAVYVRADPLLVGLDTPSTDITTDTERTKADDLYADDMSVIDIKADYYYGHV